MAHNSSVIFYVDGYLEFITNDIASQTTRIPFINVFVTILAFILIAITSYMCPAMFDSTSVNSDQASANKVEQEYQNQYIAYYATNDDIPVKNFRDRSGLKFKKNPMDKCRLLIRLFCAKIKIKNY